MTYRPTSILPRFAAAALLAAPLPVAAAELSDAFHFAYPVYQLAANRAAATERARGFGIVLANRLIPRRTLADHSFRDITTPNNDTLYSMAYLDLTGGPVFLTVPDARGRYISAAFMDAFTDHFAVIGARTPGGPTGRWMIAGPSWRGDAPPGVRLVRAPTADAWLLVRVLVDDTADLEAARAVQSGFALEPGPGAIPTPFAESAPAAPDPARFLAVVNEALGRGPLPRAAARQAAALRAFGIAPGERNAWSRLDPRVRDAWTAELPKLEASLKTGLQGVGTQHAGWFYPRAGIGEASASPVDRSRIALQGLGALPRAEAIYLTARTDSAGQPLDGRRAYTLTLPADVPAQAFWSLSMYEIAPDGRLFFTANTLNRFAIGNRSKGVRRGADGAITLSFQSTPPADANANWLPAPPGPFVVTLRAYLPKEPMLNGSFRLPAIEPAKGG